MATPTGRKRDKRRRRDDALASALISLDRSRGPLFREISQIDASERGPRSSEPHLACTRKFNRMRITDLEAIDIARAFHEKPHLKGKLPEVYERLASALESLKETEEPQPFDCPLLDGKNCMVHHVAKPIACLAWNPGRDFSRDGWHSIQRREKLNTELFGDAWHLKAIPLQLSRYLEEADRLVAGPSGSTLRKRAMRSGEIGRAAEEKKEAAERVAKGRKGVRGAARFAPAEKADTRKARPAKGLGTGSRGRGRSPS